MMTFEHLDNRFSVPLGEPSSFRMFIHHKNVAVTVLAGEEDDRVMGEAVVESREPFNGAGIVKILDYVGVATEGGKELSGGDVPFAIAPGAFFPAGKGFEHIDVLAVVEFVVLDARRDKPRFL